MATAQTVDIPDPNLRAAIETTLGKASGATITVAEMETLTFLDAIGRKIRVLKGLESAPNLRNLFLLDNSISDLTPLAGLTNLRFLALQNNAVSDLTPVIGLTNLIFLGLQNNAVSALSPLVENTELGTKDTVNVMGNLLSYLSLHTHIPALQARGVEVLFDPRTPMTPEIVSGNDQSSIVGMALAQPFVVEVLDENGLAFEGVPVTFTVTKGGGSLQSEITMTDAAGRAESLLMLGSDPGTNTVEVSAEGITETATFNAEASLPPPKPTVPSIISGGDQNGTTGEALANSFVVEVRDQYGNPMAGVAVTFTVTAGDGTLSATTVMTNANGQAETTLTLGAGAGTNTVEASIEGITETATFNAEASLPPPKPTVLSIVSGGDQNGTTGEALTDPFVVEVRDQYDDPMEGVLVNFAVTAGAGTLSATTVATNANGQAESTLTLGNDPGTNTVEASVEGLSQIAVFNAEASLPPPMATALSVISGDNQNGTTGEALTDPFVVEVHDQYDAPMAGVTVTFVVRAGGGVLSDTSVDTDASGLAQSTLTLGNDPGTNTVDVSVEGITEIETFNAVAKLLEFDLSLPSGISLIHVPLKVRTVDGGAQTIESVGDLYAALGGVDTVNWLITYDSESQSWRSYFGDSDRGSGTDKALTDDTGILASIKTPVSVRLGGDVLGMDSMSTITINQGLNLVGLPLKDSRVTRVSDLFALEGIANNVSVIIVSDNGEFKAVGREGDPGDIAITGGQSFILTVQDAATVNISGDGWDNTATGAMAAPPMMMGQIQMTGVTPVLALQGSIVGNIRRINSAGLRVNVRNLSTGSTVTAVVGDVGSTSSQVGYRLTVVDITGGRAAAISDPLEISVISPDASIGVEPLRYTVAAEDVRHSRIQLPALFLQEIPTETALLHNYPNPFNPETWIPYRLADDTDVRISIYSINGTLVRRLDLGHQRAGYYTNRSRAAYWDGRNKFGEQVATGIYFYQLQAGSESFLRKMLILK